MRGAPKRQLGLLAELAELASGTNTAEASKLARRIEPAEREHGGRALREKPARPNRIPPHAKGKGKEKVS